MMYFAETFTFNTAFLYRISLFLIEDIWGRHRHNYYALFVWIISDIANQGISFYPRMARLIPTNCHIHVYVITYTRSWELCLHSYYLIFPPVRCIQSMPWQWMCHSNEVSHICVSLLLWHFQDMVLAHGLQYKLCNLILNFQVILWKYIRMSLHTSTNIHATVNRLWSYVRCTYVHATKNSPQSPCTHTQRLFKNRIIHAQFPIPNNA